jgi:hypothetical protein
LFHRWRLRTACKGCEAVVDVVEGAEANAEREQNVLELRRMISRSQELRQSKVEHGPHEQERPSRCGLQSVLGFGERTRGGLFRQCRCDWAEFGERRTTRRSWLITPEGRKN